MKQEPVNLEHLRIMAATLHKQLSQTRTALRYDLDHALELLLVSEDEYDPQAWKDIDALEARLNYLDGALDALSWALDTDKSLGAPMEYYLAHRRLESKLAQAEVHPGADYVILVTRNKNLAAKNQVLEGEIARLNAQLEAVLTQPGIDNKGV